MDHLARVGKTHSVTAAVFDDDGACRIISIVVRPIALKLQ